MLKFRIASSFLACCLGVGVVAGCSTVPGGGPAQPSAGTQFDGVYAGDNTLVRGFGERCGPPVFQQSVTVQNGRFDYPFSPNPPIVSQIPVPIAVDGSLSVKTQYGVNEPTPPGLYKTFWLSIGGHISAAMLEATADDQWCVRHLLLRRR